MKTGYDQHFKKAQKVAAQGGQPRLNERNNPSSGASRKPLTPTNDSLALAGQLRKRQVALKTKKSRKTFPWKLVGVSLMGLMVTGAAMWKSDDIEKYSKRIEVNMMGAAYAEDAPKEAAKAPTGKDGKEAKDAKATDKKEGKAEEAPVAKKEYSEDEINHFAKLNERKRELDSREEELNRMEQELQTQKAELDKRLTELESTRRNISSVLEEKVQGDDKKVDNLVQMYSNMKPQQAAKAFEEMDESLVIEIMGRMKKKNAAEIMNLVKPDKVKVLTEKYAGYKRT